MRNSRTNEVILSSIPLNRKMKRYWISKYERIAANCGVSEAVRKFKNLRVQILRYVSDSQRKTNLKGYLGQTGFRINGYLRMLFEYADTQPHFVLSFLKLYTGPVKSEMTSDQAAGATKRRLEEVKANDAVPSFLDEWLKCLSMAPGHSYKSIIRCQGHPLAKAAKSMSESDWNAYWRKWRSTLKRGWNSGSSPEYKPVFPEIYKDYDSREMQSSSYEADFADLVSLHMTQGDSPLSGVELDFVDDYLDDDVGDELFSILWGENPKVSGLFRETTLLSGLYVGHVQHIHKKGGGTELRDIAVPNRFIQNALVPAAARLYDVVRSFPQDATFDQDRFDTKIQNRVNNDTLYQGSVDLSKATDNLPLSWGERIINGLSESFDSSSSREENAEFWNSYSLFQTIARANWEDEGYFIKWKVGQPLGSLPSFAMLAITHNLLVESLALSLGLRHSPYVILGDDIVIFNKKLRLRYIRELASRAIPLSLHKSYEGRLSEFAGKTYVKNTVPFYCSDHNPVTWNSLLDWQRTTGIRIPWNNLPRPIRKRIEAMTQKEMADSNLNPSDKKVKRLAALSYDLVQSCEVYGRGSHIYQISDSAEMSERISRYFEYRITDSPIPDPVKHTGITIIGDGHPVVLMDGRFADKDGYFLRYRPVELPMWYKSKVRPCATDAAIQASIRSLIDEVSRLETAS